MHRPVRPRHRVGLRLFVLLVQVAVSRISEQAHMQQLVAPDALSELSFDLL